MISVPKIDVAFVTIKYQSRTDVDKSILVTNIGLVTLPEIFEERVS